MKKRNIHFKQEDISIRKQVFLIMACVFTLMFAILNLIFYNSMGEMLLSRESEDMFSQSTIAENKLSDTFEYLPNVTRDWAAWDNTYKFIQGNFNEFLEYNLNDYPYELYNLDFIAILDVEGNIIYENFYNKNNKSSLVNYLDLKPLYAKIAPITVEKFENNNNIDMYDPEQYSVSGFYKHSGKLLYISSCPVIHRDKTGPAIGAMIFGRFLHNNQVNLLIDDPKIHVNIYSAKDVKMSTQAMEELDADSKYLEAIDDSSIQVLSNLKDIFGDNSLVISVLGPRKLYQDGIIYIKTVLLLVAFFCSIIIVIVLVLMDKVVIKPIGAFVVDVNNINYESDTLSINPINKYKESKLLTHAINNMLYTIKNDRDIIKKKNEDLYYTSNYDTLTGLRNRPSCRQVLFKAIAKAKDNLDIVGVILLDLDKFKNINDTMNHIIGDKCIVAITKRMQTELGDNATLGRIGGDEFVIIITNITEEFKFHLYTDKIMSIFKEPFIIGEREISITASIGISTYPKDSVDGDTLFKNSEIAMFHAKKLGGNMSVRYENELHKVLQRKLFIENKIRTSIASGCKEFRAYFQPKAITDSGDIASCEALIRWVTPEGIISPGEFIPLAEQTGLIVPLSKWMLKESCRCNKIFEEHGINQMVSVNISSQVLLHKDFFNMIEEAINDSGMSIKKLDIELTEETMLEDMPKVIKALNKLKALGITSSIDDFGTGYSSLSYLNQLPVDRIKIDRSFITGLSDNKSKNGDRPIVNAIVAMGRSLNKIITAEGVEDAIQYAYLKSVDCDEIQGYFVSRPLPCDEYITFYKSWLEEKERCMQEVNNCMLDI